MSDQAEREEKADPRLAKDPMLSMEPKEAMDPIEQAEPTEPIDRNESRDPIDSNEPRDHNDHERDMAEFFQVAVVSARGHSEATRRGSQLLPLHVTGAHGAEGVESESDFRDVKYEGGSVKVLAHHNRR